ncbi:hypothetical protein X474_16875 [Dethiosulfatarculus sandiegensis]|uniref:Uncharacterized protein n=1 Tax=Dethiosulfatarculus sandiegensis TaxID=1429043 RepID=A0A0D2JAX3_9BACT|nr:hypothetical protein X474_16875 [Dethiosulfatarculus sandiegensis]
MMEDNYGHSGMRRSGTDEWHALLPFTLRVLPWQPRTVCPIYLQTLVQKMDKSQKYNHFKTNILAPIKITSLNYCNLIISAIWHMLCLSIQASCGESQFFMWGCSSQEAAKPTEFGQSAGYAASARSKWHQEEYTNEHGHQ